MKQYISIFIGLAVLILTIPCLAFTGAGQDKAPSSSSAPASSADGEVPTAADSFKLYNHKTDKVETIPVSDYVKRVVAAEMPADYHTEALKAQAVAAHTYALNMKTQQQISPSKALNGADLSTDPATSQSYMDLEELKSFYGDKFESSYQKISDAVDAVINKVIVYDNEPIAAAFHSISGGMTEDAANVWGKSLAYLKPVLSDGDQLSPNYETKTQLSAEEVKTKLSAKFSGLTFPEDASKWITIKSLTDSKMVKDADVCGKTVSGMELRSALGLNSAYFTLSFQDGTFTFDTKGKGHGVGMSQYGADYLARQGKTYDEILKYYYSGVEIATLK